MINSFLTSPAKCFTVFGGKFYRLWLQLTRSTDTSSGTPAPGMEAQVTMQESWNILLLWVSAPLSTSPPCLFSNCSGQQLGKRTLLGTMTSGGIILSLGEGETRLSEQAPLNWASASFISWDIKLSWLYNIIICFLKNFSQPWGAADRILV